MANDKKADEVCYHCLVAGAINDECKSRGIAAEGDKLLVALMENAADLVMRLPRQNRAEVYAQAVNIFGARVIASMRQQVGNPADVAKVH